MSLLNVAYTVGDTFSIPKLEEKNMIPNTTGDILDLLSTINIEDAQGRRMFDTIFARLSNRVRVDGLSLEIDEHTGRYHIVADPDREIK